MVGIPDTDSYPQASSPREEIAGDAKNHLNKLPLELLVKIFEYARQHPDEKGHNIYGLPYPITLTNVCNSWRTAILEIPTFWTNIHYTRETREIAHIFIELSQNCPLSLTCVARSWKNNADVQEVIDDLITPYAGRWQRITISDATSNALFTAVWPSLPILWDLEITFLYHVESFPTELAVCRNAPFLRRCKLQDVFSLPPLPLNLVVFDWMTKMPLNLDRLFEFLPHVAHSLEHLRFGSFISEVSDASRRYRVDLKNLKSLVVLNPPTTMDCIRTPNLTHLSLVHLPCGDGQKVAEAFNGFSAPNLRSIRFSKTPLLPLLTSYDFPLKFLNLESVVFLHCIDESAFVPLLEPTEIKGPSPSQLGSKCLSTHQKMKNPFPKLEELVMSDGKDWTSLQVAIEKRLENGDRSLKKIQLQNSGCNLDTIMLHPTQWLAMRGIELVLYRPVGWSMFAPSVFRDDPYMEEFQLFGDYSHTPDGDDDEDLCNYDNDYDYDYNSGGE